ncbi:MAG: ribose 5-phosphate isomerase A [Gemmatimonadota bacterium]
MRSTSHPLSKVEALKRDAAREALRRVRSGMRLGLGTGSTMAHFVDLLGESLSQGRLSDVVGMPTSERTRAQATELGIPLEPLHAIQPLDLAVDGADEVDLKLDLVKGLGGAFLREKIVVQAARRFVVIVDESKSVDRLGRQAPLPVEVVPFSWEAHLEPLRALGLDPVLRKDEEEEPYRTDNGNYVLHLNPSADGFPDPAALDRQLHSRAGIVETGFLLGLADEVIFAGPEGIRTVERSR